MSKLTLERMKKKFNTMHNKYTYGDNCSWVIGVCFILKIYMSVVGKTLPIALMPQNKIAECYMY